MHVDRTSLPVVGVYHHSPEPYLPLIREILPETNLRLCRRWDGIEDLLDDVDVLLAFKFGTRPFPREAVVAAPRLRWVQVSGAGVDHLLPFDSQKLVVTNASGIHGTIMAQYVIGTLVHLLWDFPRLLRQQRERHWERWEVPTLSGKTLGVIGAGHVGSTIGRVARELGMRVVGVRRSGRPVEGFERVYGPDGLLEVIKDSDVVVLSVPLTHETRHLVGRRELESLRGGSYLVNVSRGGIVDEAALIDVLERGGIAGAVLDVFQQEPLPPESGFWSLSRVLVTPHISSELAGWPTEVARIFCANLRRWLKGEPLENVVDPTTGY
jgi:phosphoglycerate dehydrogenase-like enzyme